MKRIFARHKTATYSLIGHPGDWNVDIHIAGLGKCRLLSPGYHIKGSLRDAIPRARQLLKRCGWPVA